MSLVFSPRKGSPNGSEKLGFPPPFSHLPQCSPHLSKLFPLMKFPPSQKKTLKVQVALKGPGRRRKSSGAECHSWEEKDTWKWNEEYEGKLRKWLIISPEHVWMHARRYLLLKRTPKNSQLSSTMHLLIEKRKNPAALKYIPVFLQVCV